MGGLHAAIRRIRAALGLQSNAPGHGSSHVRVIENMDISKAENSAAVRVLRWLADSPLFIDQAYIEAFYDAVIRPEATVEKTTISTSRTGSTEKAASAKLGVEAGLPQILQTLVPGLGLKV